MNWATALREREEECVKVCFEDVRGSIVGRCRCPPPPRSSSDLHMERYRVVRAGMRPQILRERAGLGAIGVWHLVATSQET